MIRRLIKRICFFLTSEDGPTSVEYAVVIMLILMAAIGGMQVFGVAVGNSFADTDQKIGSAIGP